MTSLGNGILCLLLKQTLKNMKGLDPATLTPVEPYFAVRVSR